MNIYLLFFICQTEPHVKNKVKKEKNPVQIIVTIILLSSKAKRQANKNPLQFLILS